ncbi:MAG: serine hydrolase, partial [Candidatus Paceibacterota bacterium]
QFLVTRFLKEGDKFASENGQKGICGAVYEEWKMPYNEDGIRPTIIFNPPATVRRETHGQLPLTVLGKICAMYGTSISMTPFLNRIAIEEISGLLGELGMDPKGTEKMFDPTTGLPFANPIFFGLLPYMRERRMVDDLVQYRDHGPLESFTHAPKKGANVKAKGVKYDEMTRNAMLASGATMTSRDCMFTQAAPHEYRVCDKCNKPAYPSPMTPGVTKCDRCGNLDPATSHTVKAPYNAMLLFSILSGAGVTMETLTDAACTLAGQIPEEEDVAAASLAAPSASAVEASTTTTTTTTTATTTDRKGKEKEKEKEKESHVALLQGGGGDLFSTLSIDDHNPKSALSYVFLSWTGQSAPVITTRNEIDAQRFTADTRFRIGSIGKVIGAATVLMLEHKGLLALSDPIEKYTPHRFADRRGERITLAMLLNHSSGIGQPPTRPFTPGWKAPTPFTFDNVMKPIFEGTLFSEPGAEQSYSNFGFLLLRYAIEKVTKKDWLAAIKETILDPFGMQRTGIAATDTKLYVLSKSPDAHAMISDDPYEEQVPEMLSFAGGMTSTALDLMAMEKGLMHILPADAWKKMISTDLPPIKAGRAYAYGIEVSGRVFSHGGSIDGCTALAIFSDAPERGVVFLSNVGGIHME